MKLLFRMSLVLFFSFCTIPRATAQQLDCQPCNDHYGRVNIGTSVQRLIQLKNVGTKSLRIRAKALAGASFSFGNFPLPVTLGPGNSIKMPIYFAPSVAGKNQGSVTLTSNAKNPQFVINVQGVGVAAGQAHLAVTPSSLDFGSVNVGSSVSLPISLSASGAPVTITTAQSNSAEFTLSGFTLPVTIAVGQSLAGTIQFTPNASGTASGKLTVVSNADNSPAFLPMTGVGVVGQAHSADLSWQASTDIVVGYNVYRGGTKGGPYSKINGVLDSTTSYTDSAVAAGATYYYVATAVNADSQESSPSNEVRVVIPTP